MREASIDIDEGDRKIMVLELFEKFLDPPVEYRPQYFWFLNHKLELAELKRQLALIKQAGAGGAFLHARGGRLTPYMSEEWLDLCKGAMEYGAELGLKVWLYDEDGFPSGYAGGKTVDPNPKDFAANFIVLTEEFELKAGTKFNEKIQYEHPTSELYGVLAVPGRETGIGYELVGFPQSVVDLTSKVRNDQIRWTPPTKSVTDQWLVLVFTREWNPAAANLLSRSAMQVFLEQTHQKYEDHLKQSQLSGFLGTVVPGIFTDEPGVMYCIGDKGWRRIIPYTPEMEDLFEQRYAISLRHLLPAIFFDLEGGNPQYRLNYWDGAGDLYQEAFFRQIHDWCEAHGLAFMGHVANEGNLFNQVRDQINFFKGARFMHFGCSDQLGAIYRAEFEKNYTLANCDNMVAPCFASSAARIYGLPRVNSECFGSAGWELSLAAQKRLVDWQVAQGVNLFIPHSYNYSMMGVRKRDHPPAFNACAYFEEIRVLNDYMGRLCYLFAQPEVDPLPRVALLYGNTTILAGMTPLKGNAATYAHDAQPYLVDLLQRLHLDFDIIPEEYIAGLHARGGLLTDGHNAYALLILASLETLRAPTAEKVLELFNSGGKILFIQKIPRYYCGSKESGRLAEQIFELVGITASQLEQSLTSQTVIPEIHKLHTRENESGGILEFLQAPLLPIFKNHLMPELEAACLSSGVPTLGVSHLSGNTNQRAEIGDIVAKRREVGRFPRDTLLFLANVSDNSFLDTTIWVKGTHQGQRLWEKPAISILNPLDGTTHELSKKDWSIDESGNLLIKWDVNPEESVALRVTEREGAPQSLQLESPIERLIKLDQETGLRDHDDLVNWKVSPTKMNILNIEEWRSTFAVEKANIERPSYLQCRIVHTIWITIEEIPGECCLIVDGDTTLAPHSLSVMVNGKKVSKIASGQILDHTMLETPNISFFFTKGRNQIEVIVQGILSSPIHPLSEPLRLYGDFTARRSDSGEWVLTRWHPPLQTNLTDLRSAGLPHYTFPLDYETSFEIPPDDTDNWEFFLHLPIQDKPLYKIWVNSHEEGLIWFGTYALRLHHVTPGPNILKIRYFPFPTNLYESRGTPLGIVEAIHLKKRFLASKLASDNLGFLK